MPRNGSGSYNLPQSPFASGSIISSSAVNSDFSDIATALTGSVAADGQTPITGPIKFTPGNALAPAITFSSDQNSGFYSGGFGTIGLSLEGTTVLTVTPTVASLTIPVNATDYQIGGTSIFPLSTADIADGAITNPKLAAQAVQLSNLLDVSKGNIFSRATAGSGSPELLSISQLLDFLSGAANGTIPYRSGGAWTAQPFVEPFFQAQYQGTSLTGLTPTNTWNNYPLNTVVTNTISGASLTSNVITLPAGTYYTEGWITMYSSSNTTSICRILDVSAASFTLLGSAVATNASAGITAYCTSAGQFTLSGSTNIALQYYSNASQAPAAPGSNTAAFSDIRIWQLQP